MKDLFTENDFRFFDGDGHCILDYGCANIVAKHANKLMAKWLEREGVVVYKQPGFSGHSWQESLHDASNRTHKAILVCVEPIEKQKCEHEPTISLNEGTFQTLKPYCAKCGVKLKPKEWVEV